MPRTQAFEILGYVPAEPHFGVSKQKPDGTITTPTHYIDYYVKHPATLEKKRMRIKLNHVAGAAERKAYARRLCAEINSKLSRGWNPLLSGESVQSWHTIEQVLERYLKVKERDTEYSSPHTYRMWCRVFSEWCGTHDLLKKAIGSFTKVHARQFMEYVREERKVANATYNNYILRSSIFFIWCMRNDYIAKNPFEGMERKKKVEKFRTLITEEERRMCLDWFHQNDPPMVMVCLFVFHTLLRPGSELLRIKVGDIDLKNGVINVSGEKSAKGKRIRRPAIPDVMLPYLVNSPIGKAKSSDFVVGKGLLPGTKRCGKNLTSERWSKMRTALGWAADKELYSLRDTGIVQLIADGVDLHYVMRQAGHLDIATTNIYVQHYFPNGVETVRAKATPFVPHSAFDLLSAGAGSPQ